MKVFIAENINYLDFRCVRSSSEKSPAVSLYLIEPATCEYLLGVESPWFCNLVEKADDETSMPSSLSVDEYEEN